MKEKMRVSNTFSKLKKILLARYQQNQDYMYDILCEVLRENKLDVIDVADCIKKDKYILEILQREATVLNLLKHPEKNEYDLSVVFG
jgi:hypothetical protein